MKAHLRRLRNGLRLALLRAVGHMPSHHARLFFYRRFGMTIGRRSWIYKGAEVRNPRGITIGDDVVVGHDAVLDGRGGLHIEDNVNLSTGVWIWTMQHDYKSPRFAAVSAPVRVRADSWLSARVIVLPGVEIGRGAVVAAGAVVTKSVEPWSLNGGVPAKRIGDRDITIEYRLGDDLPTPFI
jgi:maltose O-acetyltransferase